MRNIALFLVAVFALGIVPAFAQAPAGPPAEPAAGTMIVHPVDGALMVYVPGGTFIMGMDAPEADAHAKALGYADYHAIAAEEWLPRRTVYLEGYFIDQFEVTFQQWLPYYQWAVTQNRTPKPAPPSIRLKDTQPEPYHLYPVDSVTWQEAQKYANWARKLLPTEAQWEKAARGTDGRLYPWGNEPFDGERGVFTNPADNTPTAEQMVGSKPKGASPYGCLDMAGNLYEWNADWFEPYTNNPEADRLTHLGHEFVVLRGGSFYHSNLAYSAAKRFGFRADETYYHVGFRTVWSPPAGYFESEDFKKAQAAVPAKQAEMEKLRAVGAKTPPNL